MFELNEQELEMAVGGRSGHSHSSHSTASGTGSATLGAVESYSFSTSQNSSHGTKSSAWNDTVAIGFDPTASSSSTSEARS